jgi:signal transduction histidine kinase
MSITRGETHSLLSHVFIQSKQSKVKELIHLLQRNEIDKAQNLLTVNQDNYPNLFQVFDQTGHALISLPADIEHMGIATQVLNYVRLQQLQQGASYSKQVFDKHLSIVLPADQSESESIRGRYYLQFVYPHFSDSANEMQIDFIMVMLMFLFCLFVSVFIFFESYRLSLNNKISKLKEKLNSVVNNKEPELITWEKQDLIGDLVDVINHFNLALFRQMENQDALMWDKRYEDILKSFYHDFKNPIAILKAFIDNFRLKLKRGVDLQEIHMFLDLLDKTALNAVNKIETLREYHVESKFKEILVSDQMLKFYELNKESYPNIDFTLLNKNQRPLHIKMKSFEFDLVFSNILQNAVQVLANRPKPEILIEISEATKINHTGVRISIYDNGPGIPDEIKPDLLKKYVDSSREGGWGTGMYLAARHVNKYRGSIWFESERDNGTVFHVELPTIVPS